MIVDCSPAQAGVGVEAFEPQGSIDYRDIFVGAPWKYTNMTSRFIVLCDPQMIENAVLNYQLQKAAERSFSFWDNEYDKQWNEV